MWVCPSIELLACEKADSEDQSAPESGRRTDFHCACEGLQAIRNGEFQLARRNSIKGRCRRFSRWPRQGEKRPSRNAEKGPPGGGGSRGRSPPSSLPFSKKIEEPVSLPGGRSSAAQRRVLLVAEVRSCTPRGRICCAGPRAPATRSSPARDRCPRF